MAKVIEQVGGGNLVVFFALPQPLCNKIKFIIPVSLVILSDFLSH